MFTGLIVISGSVSGSTYSSPHSRTISRSPAITRGGQGGIGSPISVISVPSGIFSGVGSYPSSKNGSPISVETPKM